MSATQHYLNSRELKAKCPFVLATTTSQFIILFPKTVTNGEEVPAPFSTHVPHIGLLTCALIIRSVDEMHQEQPVTKRQFSASTWISFVTNAA
jgi:hypothetical protein